MQSSRKSFLALFVVTLAISGAGVASDAAGEASGAAPDTTTPVADAAGTDTDMVTSPEEASVPTARSAAAPTLSREQLEAAMAEAQERRAALLRPDPAAPNEILAERWGVEVIGIWRTAGGYMLDFRFRVVDQEKALPLFDHRTKPYVTAEKSGINLPVPVGAKTGAMRPTNRGKNIKADKTYYMVFANPDMHLKPGDKVSVVIGDFRVEHLTVN